MFELLFWLTFRVWPLNLFVGSCSQMSLCHFNGQGPKKGSIARAIQLIYKTLLNIYYSMHFNKWFVLYTEELTGSVGHTLFDCSISNM